MLDRYAKAVEQLADDKVTIRLGGVYVLAALAEDWRARDNYRQQQVCVDMLCSYLRSAEYKVVDGETALAEAYTQVDWDKLKKDQPVRKAALECLSEIKRREVEGPEGVLARGVGELRKFAYGSLGISPPPPLRMDLQGIQLVGLDLRHARLTYLHLENAKLMSADLTRADLTSAKLNHAALNGATLTDTNLTRTDLSDASIINCSLKGAYIIGTKLANATITPPYVDGNGSMDGAFIIGVDLAAAFRIDGTGSSVIIDEETLDSARNYMDGGEGQSIRRRTLDADDPDDLARVRNLLAAAGLGEKSDGDLWRAKKLTISLPERDTAAGREVMQCNGSKFVDSL
ncbi:pentapeptide repeat-containing protein [Rhodococcus erythropolis]|uniref:pentapeptide repeat-containing protein n=1 Tax=Rhodococcus erythropolis TaxID=1833 RepID=UPI0037B111E8